ncbi:MAG: transketolase C-terminal domain-containing protein [Bacteroidales bacterium]|nr:transketolase C-terminal domain-containing protein [Bacteroidales bacterium]
MNKTSSTRVGFMQGLEALAEQDERIMLVCADSLKAMRADPFLEKFPDRVVELGIAEQNAAGVSAGLALGGLIPYFATYAGFITMRACEQIRTFIAYPNLDVKLVGINGGLAAGEREGVSHQFFEDLAILRSIPNLTILVPADAGQARQAAIAAAEIPGPVYIRLGSGRDPVIFDDKQPFVPGKIHLLEQRGNDLVFFCNGLMIPRVLVASAMLAAKGIACTVAEVHTLKPLDTEGVTELLKDCGAAVTAEDHNIIGGLGSAIMECAAEHCPVPVSRIGLRDVFPGSGHPEALLDFYGMSVNDMVDAAITTINRKPNPYPNEE